MLKSHSLKTETAYYQAVENGKKTFEVRKNDRDFKVGDWLCLEEVVNGVYTGRKIMGLEIIYVLHGGQFGIEDGYCVLQFKKISPYTPPPLEGRGFGMVEFKKQ